MKTTFFFFTTFSLCTVGLFAQNSAHLSINNIKAGFTQNGGLYQTDSSWTDFKIKNAQEKPSSMPVRFGWAALKTECSVQQLNIISSEILLLPIYRTLIFNLGPQAMIIQTLIT